MNPERYQLELDVIQRWMQSVIMHPCGVVAGLESDSAQQEIPLASDQLETVIDKSRRQSSQDRLAVYANAYQARLLEVMLGEYPALVHALGEDVFIELAAAYLVAHPPTSHTVAALGRDFPDHLKRTRPPRECTDTEADWADFLIDLARLERHYSEVFDGPGIENQPTLRPEQFQSLSPESWAVSKLIPVPCLRLATFRFPVQEYATAVRQNLDAVPPEPQTTRLAITRRDFVVRRIELEESEFQLLTQVISGKCIGTAIEVALRSHAAPFDDLAGQVATWFRHWSAVGYFIGFTS